VPSSSARAIAACAFTLLELLVVIAVIAVLAALLLPVLARTKQKAQGACCLNNGNQLMKALRLYSSEYQSMLPPNPDWQCSNMWVAGDMGKPADATNAALLTDPARSVIAPFLSGSAAVFKCPGDRTAHVRTASMSQAVGTQPFSPGDAVDGPWLDGTHHHKANQPWRTYGQLDDIVAPAPSRLWVLIDEDAANISDAAFAVSMAMPTAMLDWPGSYHELGANLQFADGHGESHRWRDSRTRPGGRVAKGPHVQTPANPDILWLQQRTSSNLETETPQHLRGGGASSRHAAIIGSL